MALISFEIYFHLFVVIEYKLLFSIVENHRDCDEGADFSDETVKPFPFFLSPQNTENTTFLSTVISCTWVDSHTVVSDLVTVSSIVEAKSSEVLKN